MKLTLNTSLSTLSDYYIFAVYQTKNYHFAKTTNIAKKFCIRQNLHHLMKYFTNRREYFV